MFKIILCFACGVRGPHDQLPHPGTGKSLWKCRNCGAWTALPGDLSESQTENIVMDSMANRLDPVLIASQRGRLALSLVMFSLKAFL